MYEVTPSSVNMSDLASPKSDIPRILAIQSIVVEYSEEYIIIMSRGFHWVSRLLGCWRWWTSVHAGVPHVRVWASEKLEVSKRNRAPVSPGDPRI